MPESPSRPEDCIHPRAQLRETRPGRGLGGRRPGAGHARRAGERQPTLPVGEGRVALQRPPQAPLPGRPMSGRGNPAAAGLSAAGLGRPLLEQRTTLQIFRTFTVAAAAGLSDLGRGDARQLQPQTPALTAYGAGCESDEPGRDVSCSQGRAGFSLGAVRPPGRSGSEPLAGVRPTSCSAAGRLQRLRCDRAPTRITSGW